ncbi:MAG: hypothetical protein Q8N08_00425 [Methanobacteriaceae archaeon]|nr:hypothetical protein [Methanobacteriaceae archaeon]
MSKIQVNKNGDLIIDDHYISSHYYQSKNENYIVAFSSSHGMENKDGNTIKIPGKLYLIENKSKILWEKEFIKLNSSTNAFVSDDGRVILCGNKEYYLFSKESQELFIYTFNSNIFGSEFCENNSILIVTTAIPEDKIYCFNINETKLRWVKNNHSRVLIHVIEFLDNNTIYLSANRYDEDSYCIDLDGNLIVGSIKESEIRKRMRLFSAAQSKFDNKQYAEAESLFSQAYIITDKFMFSWDDILGTNKERLLKILNRITGLDYTQIPRVEIIDSKTIKISVERTIFIFGLNDEKTKVILESDYGVTYEFIAKIENNKIEIYKNIVDDHEDIFHCKCIAKTKYQLEKYAEAIDYWEKAIDIAEKFYKRLKAPDDEIKLTKQTIEKDVFRAYRKLISLYKEQGKKDCVENIIQQFFTKYPNQSNEVLPKLRSRKNKENSFLINPMNSSVSLKFIKNLKTQKKPSLIRFIDNKLIYLDGSQKPYNLIKTNEFFETEWKIHYLDTINNICCVDKTIIVHTTKWESEDSVHTKLWFINNHGAEVSNFNFNSYVRFSSFNSNLFVIWSVDSKIRNFNGAGDLVWDYDTKILDKYNFKDMSISDTGLILYAIKDTAYLIDKGKKELIKWICPKEPVEEEHLFRWDEIPGNDNDKLLEFIEKKYGIDWVKNAKIGKCDDGKAIYVSTDKNSISIRLDDEDGLGYLEIDDGRSDILIVDDENGKIVIDEFQGEEGSINVKMEVIVKPFNDIRALKISPDSKYILLGCYSGDLFCLNMQNQVIWHHKISSHQINEIILSNDGENLVIKSEDGYIYFIDKGKILNKYKLANRKILAEYHNNKQLFFISDGKEFSIFDKSGTLLNKIIFNNDVNWFDISEKLNAIAIASSDGIDIFSILFHSS